MHEFEPTIIEVKRKSLPDKSFRSIKHQGFQVKRVKGNATIKHIFPLMLLEVFTTFRSIKGSF